MHGQNHGEGLEPECGAPITEVTVAEEAQAAPESGQPQQAERPISRDERHSVEYAANRIAGLFGADRPTETPRDEPTTPSDTTRDESGRFTAQEGSAEVEPEGKTEASSKPEVQTEEAPEAAAELPSTLDELAAAFEVPPEKLRDLKVKAKIDGEEVEVTLSDAIAGYQRTQDYTRKTTELSEQRTEFERAVSEAEAELRSRAERLSTLTLTLERQLGGKEPNWDALANNPAEYLKAQRDWQQKQMALRGAQAERNRLMQAEQAQQAHKLQSFVENERQKMTTNWPELADPDAGKVKAIKSYLTEKGFSRDDIAQIYDHRMIGVLMDAIAAREVSNATPEKKLMKPKPGKTLTPAAKGSQDSKTDRIAAARRNARANPKNMNAHAARIRAILG